MHTKVYNSSTQKTRFPYTCVMLYNIYMTINELLQKLSEIETSVTTKLQTCQDTKQLQDLQISALGRKGALTELLKNLKDLSLEEKKLFGPKSNALKQNLTAAFEAKLAELSLKEINDKLNQTKIDLTLPALYRITLGKI